jgi:hypothetical protein
MPECSPSAEPRRDSDWEPATAPQVHRADQEWLFVKVVVDPPAKRFLAIVLQEAVGDRAARAEESGVWVPVVGEEV